MNCESFHDRIEGYLAGGLEPAEMAAARAHVAHCADCAAAVRVLSATVHDPAEPAARGLTEAILRETSGSVCRGVQERLCPLRDGELDETEAWLVREHLGHCRSCAALERTLAGLVSPLAAMASLPLDANFTQDVMRATVGASRPAPGGWRSRLASFWGSVHRRPRFAMELSYGLTVLLVLLTGTPVSPLRDVPGRALDWLQGGVPAASSSESGERLASGWNPAVAIPAPVRATGSRIRGDLESGLEQRQEQLAWVWERFGGHRRDLGQALGDRDLGRIGAALEQIGCDLRLFWRGLRNEIPGPEALAC